MDKFLLFLTSTKGSTLFGNIELLNSELSSGSFRSLSPIFLQDEHRIIYDYRTVMEKQSLLREHAMRGKFQRFLMGATSQQLL